MIINNISRYQSWDIKAKAGKGKPSLNAVSQAAPQDFYEPSANRERGEIRYDLISAVKKKINNGFYQSKDVLEQLSDSFAQALNQTL